MAFVAAVLAAFCTVGSILFGIMTFTNPHNDIGRAYTSIAMVLLCVFAFGLWLLVGSWRKTGNPTAEDDWNRTK